MLLPLLPNSQTEGQRLEILAVTPVVGVWTAVVTADINKVANITVYDSFNREKVELQVRKNAGGTQYEILSQVAATYTVHVEGYVI